MPKKRKSKRKSIVGLKWARKVERPSFISEEKLQGAALAGVNYEKKVAKNLQALLGEDRVLHGQWFNYVDRYGSGYCQTDVLVLPDEPKSPLLICEVKLTVTDVAEQKLRKFYKKVVEKVFAPPHIKLVQIAHNLKTTWTGRFVNSLEEVYNSEEDFITWIVR